MLLDRLGEQELNQLLLEKHQDLMEQLELAKKHEVAPWDLRHYLDSFIRFQFDITCHMNARGLKYVLPDISEVEAFLQANYA